jgi:hypothetical protein
MGSVVERFEAGACVVTVWANAVKRAEGEVVLHNVSVGRAYKDREGRVQWTGSLRPQDVPAVMLALGRAYAYLLDLSSAEAGEERAA